MRKGTPMEPDDAVHPETDLDLIELHEVLEWERAVEEADDGSD